MKILVVEDTPKHQQAAAETLVGHDLTVVGCYREAVDLLSMGEFEVVLLDLMIEVQSPFPALGPNGDQYIGLEMPLGFPLALLAAEKGAKFVAVVTDANHHDHPMSSSLDPIGGPYWYEGRMTPNFVINGAKALFAHTPFLVRGNKCCPKCQSTGRLYSGDIPAGKVQCSKCNEIYAKGESTDLKDWGEVLRTLLA